MLQGWSATLRSDAFAQLARHPNHPRAFTRRRALPLSTLVATLQCLRGASQQALVENDFTALSADAQPVCSVSDRAFAKARPHLHVQAVTALNDKLLARAETAGLLPRWQGLRLVAADA